LGHSVFATPDLENSVLQGRTRQTRFLLSQISQAELGKLNFRQGGFNKPGFCKAGFRKPGFKKPDLANPIFATPDLEYAVSQGRIWQTQFL
jgi:hypothetical protein